MLDAFNPISHSYVDSSNGLRRQRGGGIKRWDKGREGGREGLGERLMLLEKGEAVDGGGRMITQSRKVADAWGSGFAGVGEIQSCVKAPPPIPRAAPGSSVKRYSGENMVSMCPPC